MEKQKHCDLILQHMKTYGSINPKEAENEYGCMRLAARIKDLRNRGVAIDSRGGDAWHVRCFNCGHTVDKGNKVRHDAQVAWNKESQNGSM